MDSAKIACWKLSFWWCAVVHWSDACCLKHANEISPLCMMFKYVFIFCLKQFLLSLHYGVLFLIFEGFFLSRKIEIQQPFPLSLCLAKQYWLQNEVFYYLFFCGTCVHLLTCWSDYCVCGCHFKVSHENEISLLPSYA